LGGGVGFCAVAIILCRIRRSAQAREGEKEGTILINGVDDTSNLE
jgi:hypothetical protein